MIRNGIAAAGNLIVDYVKIIDGYPKQGNLANIADMSKAIGGAVPNVLIDIAKMDSTVALQAIGLIGRDEDGESIVAALDRFQIDTALIQRHDTLGTSFTDVMSAKTGERTFFQYRGANAAFSDAYIDFSKIQAKILHVGYALLLDAMDAPDPEHGTVMARTLRKAQENGILTSMDVVSENSDRFSKIVPASLRYTDYCVINEVEAAQITGICVRGEDGVLREKPLREACRKLREMGVRCWAVIHAPEAGCGIDENENFVILPSIDIPKSFIKGKVGAGDAFCAGVLYAAYQAWPLEKALRVATAAATCSLSARNATDGMQPYEKIMELYEVCPLAVFAHDERK